MQRVDSRIEQRGLWWTFHKHLIVELFQWLRERLGEAYLVDFESQVLLIPRFSGPGRSVSPDVEVSVWVPERAGSAGLTPTPALLEADEALDEFEQDAIYIRRRDQPDAADPFGSRVVSIIELLSPSNKGLTGSADRRKFLAKRQDYLTSSVSYTEIDLLEGGKRDLPQAVERLEAYPHMVWASQVQVESRHHWGWGWGKDDPVPAITLPLDYPHVHTLDLGQCYEGAYVRNRWSLRLEDEGVTG